MAKKPIADSQTRLQIRVSDSDHSNLYTSVNFAAVSTICKGSIAILAEKHNLTYNGIEILLFIKAMGGKAKINRTKTIFHVNAIHHYYKTCKTLLLPLGYVNNERFKTIGRFRGHIYSLTLIGDSVCSEFNQLCASRIKLILNY